MCVVTVVNPVFIAEHIAEEVLSEQSLATNLVPRTHYMCLKVRFCRDTIYHVKKVYLWKRLAP